METDRDGTDGKNAITRAAHARRACGHEEASPEVIG